MVKQDEYTVYKLTNKNNGKIYIGMSNNIKRRWRNNGIEYTLGNNTPISNAMKKYGLSQFHKEILYNKLDYTNACKIERDEIEKQRSRISGIGYNVAEGGNGGRIYKHHPRGMLGKKHSKDFCMQKSKEMLENNPCYPGFWSEKGRKHPRGMLGKTHKETTKSKISKSLKGVNAKVTTIIYPSGVAISFPNRESAATFLDISPTGSIFIKLLKSKQPFKHHYKKHQYLDGVRIL